MTLGHGWSRDGAAVIRNACDIDLRGNLESLAENMMKGALTRVREADLTPGLAQASAISSLRHFAGKGEMTLMAMGIAIA